MPSDVDKTYRIWSRKRGGGVWKPARRTLRGDQVAHVLASWRASAAREDSTSDRPEYLALPVGEAPSFVLRSNPCVTDRALRYRANRPDVAPRGPRRCLYCGSDRNVEVHHLDGDESNTAPLNLAWSCRSCNTRIGVAMRKLGLGRRTHQYNPGAQSAGQWAWALARICRRQDELAGRCSKSSDPEVLGAVEMIRATPAARRREFSAVALAARGRYGRAGVAGEVPF